MIGPNHDMIDHGLLSPFSYLVTLVADLCEEPHQLGPRLVRGIRNGEPLTIPVERFLGMLRFEQCGRLSHLPLDLESPLRDGG